MSLKTNLKFTFLLVWIGFLGFSQQFGSVKGFVYDKSNGEPLPFCNVYLKGTTLGANTDLNGYFSITRIPAGSYIIMITSLEFDTIREKIEIKSGEILSRKFYANKGGISLQEVEISATSTEKIENTTVATQIGRASCRERV